MKQQEVFKKIGGIIKELNDQYEYLKTVDGQLNELELELFIANAHFLSDHISILAKLNSQLSTVTGPVKKEDAPQPPVTVEVEESVTEIPEPTPEPEIHEEKYFEPLVQPLTKSKHAEPEKADVVEEKFSAGGVDLGAGDDKDNFEYIRDEEPETIRHELILDEADWEEEDEPQIAEEGEVEIPPEPEREVPKIEEIKPVAVKPAPVVDIPVPPKQKAEEKVITLNQKISAQMGEKAGIGEQLGAQTVSDLKAAINLNDKLLYVKDLFNGYSLAYSEAIEILNRFTSFEEADLFLKKNYTVKNKWEDKPETTGKFYALLKRRYE
jgi:hypothetical protein